MIKKTITLNGRQVEAWVPDPNIPKEEALNAFIEDIRKIVNKRK